LPTADRGQSRTGRLGRCSSTKAAPSYAKWNYLGVATNNVASGRASSRLEAALELGIDDLAVRLDSELVVSRSAVRIA